MDLLIRDVQPATQAKGGGKETSTAHVVSAGFNRLKLRLFKTFLHHYECN